MRPKSEADVIADRLFAAIEAGDVDTVGDLYADDVVVWHNFDQATQTKEQSLAVLRWMTKNLADRRYEVVARFAVEGGFVQQHTLYVTYENGFVGQMDVCFIGYVRDGKLSRIYEYFDTGQIGKFLPPREKK